MPFEFVLDIRDHVGAVRGDIYFLAWIMPQMKQQRLFKRKWRAWNCVPWCSLEMSFEYPFANCKQFVAAIVNHSISFARPGAEENRRQIHAINDPILWDCHAR